MLLASLSWHMLNKKPFNPVKKLRIASTFNNSNGNCDKSASNNKSALTVFVTTGRQIHVSGTVHVFGPFACGISKTKNL